MSSIDPRRFLSFRLHAALLPTVFWLVAGLSAGCTQYRVVSTDAGSEGSGDTGGRGGGGVAAAAGGKDGGGTGGRGSQDAGVEAPMGVDGGVDAAAGAGGARVDASVTDVAPFDAGVDLPPDTGPVLATNGTACRLGTECQSGSCVDGVCCESGCAGQCQSCAEPGFLGKCVTISGTVRGARTACAGQGTCASSCNGSDALQCHYPGTEKVCSPASCAGGTARIASTCNGTGACTTVASTPCASNLCADATQCAGGCSATQPCAAGQYCQPGTNVCVPLKANGAACSQKIECASQACVDGFCCDTLCTGQCEACGEPGSVGRCVAVQGAPRGASRPPCAGVRDACRGTCNLTSTAQCSYHGAEVTCVPASCAGGSLTAASVCNSLGDCTTPPPATACHSGQCSTTPGQCLVCTPGLVCAGGLICDTSGGVCLAPAGLTISPLAPPSFDSTPVGQVSATTQTFTVTNTGGNAAGTAVPVRATLSGTDAAQFTIVAASTTCVGTLAAGAPCRVVVSFNPTTVGLKSASLGVSATPGGTTLSVALSGTGLRRLGDVCGATSDCPVGFCVDGHCCATATCGTCKSCVGAAGTCANTPLNTADSDSCVGVCDGNGGCKPPGSILWARSMGAAWLYAGIEGPAGVVATGTITAPATVNLGGATLTPVGATDSFLGQFATADGTHISSTRFGGSTPMKSGTVNATGSLLEASGTSIVHGVSFCDPGAVSPCAQISLGLGLANPGGGPGADGFVGRYSIATGVPSWLATLKGTTEDHITAVTSGPNGTIFIGGWYDEGPGQSTTLTSGASLLQFAGGGDRDILIAQLNPTTGAIGMTKTFAGPGFEEPDSIAWTGSEVVAAGFFAGGGTNFGVRTLPLVGGFDIWVAKLNPVDGSAAWAVALASTGDDKYPSLVVDAVGDIYVTGFVGAATTLGGFPVGGAGGSDIFVAKLRNADGSVVWAKSLGSAADDIASAIAINASGQVAVAGNIGGPLQPGGPWSGATDAVVASFTSEGARLWTKVIGTAAADYATGVTSGASSFYAAVNLAIDIGPSVEGVPIVGTPAPAGLLLKVQP